MVKTPDIAEPREPQVPDRLYAGARRRVLFIICFGFFLVLLDTTALNIATPALGREFGDGIGVKRSYQAGLALFALASLLSAVAPSLVLLILARAIQGLGAAIMLPASLALLSHAFPDPAERSHAVTTWATTASLGFAFGPLLGGVLT